MSTLSPTAMILAAGLGTRLRPLTLTTPKPLIEVGGRTMLDHALDKLVAMGITRVIINSFYLADQIERHARARSDITIVISRESELLDTGGGIKNVLDQFDNLPFLCLNADLPWIDGPVPSLERMRSAWSSDIMDALLLMMPTHKARGFEGSGDFNLSSDGRLSRHNANPPRSHVWISAQILKPELFTSVKETTFSNNVIWTRTEAKGRLYGLEHDGTCYHVGTPQDWQKANDLLASGAGWAIHE